MLVAEDYILAIHHLALAAIDDIPRRLVRFFGSGGQQTEDVASRLPTHAGTTGHQGGVSFRCPRRNARMAGRF